MNSASLITNVLSRVTIPDNELEKITTQFFWIGNDYKKGLKKSDDIFSIDHESVYFSSVPVKVTGRIEITFLTGNLHTAGCTSLPVNTGFLLTWFKGSENIIKAAWSSSLS